MSKKRAEMRTINAKQTHRNKDEPDDRAEWLKISLTASISMRDEVFGRDRANFRGFINVFPLAVGWSARGGNTINAYDLSYTSWGSSSGSGAGAAANLCAAAGGTGNHGSVHWPTSGGDKF